MPDNTTPAAPDAAAAPAVSVRGLDHLQHAEELLAQAELARKNRDLDDADALTALALAHTGIATVWLEVLDKVRTAATNTLSDTLRQARNAWAAAGVDMDGQDR
ncbi:hypothetical protein [Nonomuraea typhae]|uniref:ANTAR domain-containing protein n=1 Tax=Nonomuraea typhae TaxID=2603600 RepID=A0ABW7YS16_9ACTN